MASAEGNVNNTVPIDEYHTRVLAASCYLPLHAFNPSTDLCADPVSLDFISVDNLPPKPPSAWRKLWGTAPTKGSEEKKDRLLAEGSTSSGTSSGAGGYGIDLTGASVKCTAVAMSKLWSGFNWSMSMRIFVPVPQPPIKGQPVISRILVALGERQSTSLYITIIDDVLRVGDHNVTENVGALTACIRGFQNQWIHVTITSKLIAGIRHVSAIYINGNHYNSYGFKILEAVFPWRPLPIKWWGIGCTTDGAPGGAKGVALSHFAIYPRPLTTVEVKTLAATCNRLTPVPSPLAAAIPILSPASINVSLSSAAGPGETSYTGDLASGGVPATTASGPVYYLPSAPAASSSRRGSGAISSPAVAAVPTVATAIGTYAPPPVSPAASVAAAIPVAVGEGEGSPSSSYPSVGARGRGTSTAREGVPSKVATAVLL